MKRKVPMQFNPSRKEGFFYAATEVLLHHHPKEGVSAMRKVYAAICAARTLIERLDDGGNATLKPWATGWLAKSDRIGVEPQVAYEYEIYKALEAEGLAGVVTPECLLEEGVFGYPDTIIISQINMGASIGEYAEAYLAGQMPAELWLDLCQKTGEVINTFHDGDFVHCDLHCGNVVIEITVDGEWRPVLIDFGVSSFPKELEYPYALNNYNVLNPQSDIPFLVWSLEAISLELTRKDSDFQKGLAALMKASN
jgi:hypothetical protein